MSGHLINVNKIINHSAILQELGIKYKGDSQFAKCPFCNKQSLARFMRTSYAEDVRYYCYGCRMKSDLFDLYRTLNDIEHVNQVFYDLMSANMMMGGSRAVSDADIQHYSSKVVHVTAVMNDYWNDCQTNMYQGNLPIGKQLLQTMGIWPGIMTRNNYIRSAFSFIGISGKQHVLDKITTTNLKKGLKKQWAAFIVYPYEVTPGQVRNFVIQNDKGYKKLHKPGTIVEPKLHNAGDGFFMLSSVQPGTEVTYAFSEPGMALQAQRSHLSRGSKHYAPIVAWGDETDLDDWHHLPGKRIIMYSPVLSVEVLTHAILCGSRARITTTPSVKSATVFNEEYRTKGVPFHKAMEVEAVSWPEALLTFFMDSTIEASIELVSQLPIGNLEQSQIMKACEYSAETDRVSRIFGSDDVQNRYVDVDSYKVYEENGCWYGVYADGSRKLVCDTPIYIDELITDPDNKLPTVAVGYILHNNIRMNFTVPFSTAEEKPLKAYKKILEDMNVFNTKLDSKFGKHVISASLEFQKPTVIKQPSVIGYSSATNEFRLASLLVSGNGVVLSPQISQREDGQTPTAGISKYESNLPANVADNVLKPGARNEAFLAVLGAFFRNVVCYAMELEPRPIAVIGMPYQNYAGWKAVAEIAKAFNIPVSQVSDCNAKTISSILEECDKHRLPVILGTDILKTHESKKLLAAVAGKNVIVSVSEAQALALSISGKWSIIRAMASTNKEERVENLWHAIGFLEYYLKMGAPNYSAEDSLPMIIDDLKMWLLPSTKLPEAEYKTLFDNAKSVAIESKPIGTLDRLLHVMCTLAAKSGKTQKIAWLSDFRETGIIDNGDKVVLIDSKDNVCFIDMRNFITLCNDYGCTEIQASMITEFFEEAGILVTDKLSKGVFDIPGWVITADDWNAVGDGLAVEKAIRMYS